MSTPIESAVGLLGGPAKAAKRLGVTSPTVCQWVSGRRPVPPGRATQIEDLLDGRVTRWELRPDYYGVAPVEDRVA
ncbi:Cro/CI family transcriptional regulator [Algiphilus sp.]|uniref:transcriptional regulator n=1 Tax=Algiphilus sp. TaxID=1872431 RepID=UPI0025BE08BA|nr:Cro/CI family transcriptional regulator [Algiphilus sp.]MCK5770914.1 helix-turn-helix domain-containing protein [Algiphilus sp.]